MTLIDMEKAAAMGRSVGTQGEGNLPPNSSVQTQLGKSTKKKRKN